VRKKTRNAKKELSGSQIAELVAMAEWRIKKFVFNTNWSSFMVEKDRELLQAWITLLEEKGSKAKAMLPKMREYVFAREERSHFLESETVLGALFLEITHREDKCFLYLESTARRNKDQELLRNARRLRSGIEKRDATAILKALDSILRIAKDELLTRHLPPTPKPL
jgi:hypothetical protein